MLYEQSDQPLFFFDVTAVAMMLVLAYLSKRLGEAMRIRPYYLIFFATSAAVVVASGLETIPLTLRVELLSTIANSVRLTAAAVAFAAALRYWGWLFKEFARK